MSLANSPVALERPESATPWRNKALGRKFWITLASVIPALVAAAVIVVFKVDFAVTLIAVFLPLQVALGSAVGFIFHRKRGISDALLGVFVVFSSALVLVLLGSLLSSVVLNGAKAMSWQFISQNNVYISPTTSLQYGGIGHALLGSVLVVGLTTIVTVPLGLAIAVYLTETRGKTRSTIRTLIQAISGLPSVVSGLFIYSALIVTGIAKPEGWTGSLALFPLMLPTITRIAEESLLLVPKDLRSAALGLGAPNYKVFLQVVLPAAKSGVITAVLLGIARIIGETAPLLLTTFAANETNANVFHGPISTLPFYLYSYVSNPSVTSTQRAWGAALVILIFVLILFAVARMVTRKPQAKKTSKGKK